MTELSPAAEAVCEVLDVTHPGGRTLTDLGLDSLSAARLQRLLAERTGVRVPLREFLGDANMESIDRAVGAAGPNGAAVGAVSAGGDARDPGTAESGRFSLSPVQGTYWVGRGDDYPLGGVSTYFYHEYELAPMPDREPHDRVTELETAWNQVVARHPMLRAVVGRDGEGQILAEPGPHRFEIVDLRDAEDPDGAAALARADLSHRRAPAHRWPLHTIAALIRPGGALTLCVGFDVLLIDFPGIRRVLAEWGRAYRGDTDAPAAWPSAGTTRQPPETTTPPAAEEASDLEFWRSRSDDLPGGPWDVTGLDVDALTPPRFRRSVGVVPAATWEAFCSAAGARGLTPPGALAALMALALRRFGARERFCLITTLFDPDGGSGDVGDGTRTALLDTDRPEPSEGVADYMLRVGGNLWDAVEHSSIPAARVVGDLLGSPLSAPEYSVVLTTALGERAGTRSDAWLGRRTFGVSQTPQILMDAIHWEEDGDLVLAWDHVIGGVDADLVDGMRTSVENGIATLSSDEGAWSRPGLFLDPWGRTPEPRRSAFRTGPGIHEPALAALSRAGSRRAVAQGGRSASGDEVLALATQIRLLLADVGVRAAEPVLVAMDKSVEQVGVVLGITSAGAAYVPVDPAWPAVRVDRVARRSGARFAVVGPAVDMPDGVEAIRIPVGSAAPGLVDLGGPVTVAGDDLAYAIFTSGSTGEPKGVAIEHAQARTTIDDLAHRFSPGSGDVVFGLSALSFDLSVWDIFGALGAGARLVLPEAGSEVDPEHWLRVMGDEGVTIWNSAPALAEMLVDHAEYDRQAARTAFRDLRLVLLSGDWIPVTLPDRLRDLAPHSVVVSLGGATEASIWSIHHVIDRVDPDWPSVPYGTALDGQWFRILDSTDGSPVPVGTVGELFIGGHGVARGYLGDQRQTAERFRIHPVYGERLYRTGDEGMWTPDGNIRFIGRVDRQVKINGFRVELGEVDAALTRLDGVRGGVCAAVSGPGGGKRLVGHIAPVPGADLDERSIRVALSDRLPSYMIPTALVFHRELPVTANGKIDHGALPDPFDRDRRGMSGDQSRPVAELPEPDAGPPMPEPVPERSREQRGYGEDAPGTPPGLAPDLAALLPPGINPVLEPLAAGLDSLAVVRIANLVEDRTGRRPRVDDLLATPLNRILSAESAQAATPGSSHGIVPPVQSEQSEPSELSAPPMPRMASPEADGRPPVGEVDLGSPVRPAPSGTPELPDLTEVVASGAGVQVEITVGAGEASSQLLAAGHWLRAAERSAKRNALTLEAEVGGVGRIVTVRFSDPGAGMAPVGTGRFASSRAPLTELQVAYLVGRADTWLGDPVPPRYRTEIEVEDLDVGALGRALDAVVDAHPMLRARVDEDGRQVIDDRARPVLEVDDLGRTEPAEIERIRQRRRSEDMKRPHDPQSGRPWLELRATRLPEGSHTHRSWVVVLVLDMLFCDVRGAQIIARDLTAAYRGAEVASPAATFLSWAGTRAGAGVGEEPVAPVPEAGSVDPDRIPAPAAPGPGDGPVLLPARAPESSEFRRRIRRIDTATTTELIRRCGIHRTSPDALLVTVLGAVLASGEGAGPPVVVTVLDRPEDHRDVVGEYTSTVVVDPPAGESTSIRSRAASAAILDGVLDLGRDGSAHGNLRVRRHLRSGGATGSLPVVYSSGLTGWSGEAAPYDALAGLGTTVHSISSTPQVLLDLQSFRDVDGALVLVMDAVEDAFGHEVLDAVLRSMSTALTSLANSDGPWHEPGFPAPAAADVPSLDVTRLRDLQGDRQGRHRTARASVRRSGGSAHEVSDSRRAVVDAVATLLGREPGNDELDTGFFALGLASMHLVRLRGELADLGHDVALTDLFTYPDIRSLTRYLDSATSSRSPEISAHSADPEPAPTPADATMPPATSNAAEDPVRSAELRGRRRRRILQEDRS